MGAVVKKLSITVLAISVILTFGAINNVKADIIHCNHVIEHVYNDEGILKFFKKSIFSGRL